MVSDAYRALLRSDQHYDVIASEPSNPWVTGIEMLFSQEFLSAAKDRLRPGGVYAQWFHCYENDTSVVELVLRTYASVFDHVAVWYTLGPDLILLGFKDPDVERVLDVRRLQARFAEPAMNAALRRAGIENFPALLVHELLPLGVVNAAGWHGDVHTILHPVLSHRAARAFFRGQQAELPLALTPGADGDRRAALAAAGATRGASAAALPDARAPPARRRSLQDATVDLRDAASRSGSPTTAESPDREARSSALLQAAAVPAPSRTRACCSR